MISEFQPRDIQKIVAISTRQYEYIVGSIGIIPDVQEIEKTGTSYLYSFKNLLEFAVAQQAAHLGMKPKTISRLLDFLDALEEPERVIYDIRTRTDIKIYYINYGGARYFQIYQLIFPIENSAEIVEALDIPKYLSGGRLKTDHFFREQLRPLKKSSHPEIDQLSADIENFRQLNLAYPDKVKLLDAADGYVVINLGRVKRKIQFYLER
ncbi:MAG: hypothetical protein JSV83_21570 [Desulfobacterales bacterium]|nr:MAG: hypothetical protein JSV83_21570 [Desulfobacterales bacterium]